MKNYKEELIEYFNQVMSFDHADERTKKDWMFGAADFSFKAGLIDMDTYDEILSNYVLNNK